jgi:hypothetical protein
VRRAEVKLEAAPKVELKVDCAVTFEWKGSWLNEACVPLRGPPQPTMVVMSSMTRAHWCISQIPLAYEPSIECHCKMKVPRLISRSDENPGWRYYRCKRARVNHQDPMLSSFWLINVVLVLSICSICSAIGFLVLCLGR